MWPGYRKRFHGVNYYDDTDVLTKLQETVLISPVTTQIMGSSYYLPCATLFLRQ